MSCSVCFSKDSTFVYIPCGHRCICEDCVLRVDTCPICRNGKHPIRIIDNGTENNAQDIEVTEEQQQQVERRRDEERRERTIELNREQPDPTRISVSNAAHRNETMAHLHRIQPVQKMNLDPKNWKRLSNGLKEYLVRFNQAPYNINLFCDQHDKEVKEYMKSRFTYLKRKDPTTNTTFFSKLDVDSYFGLIGNNPTQISFHNT